MGLLSRLKKNKTLRSVLGAAALFAMGTPSMVEAAPKTQPRITQNTTDKCQSLAKEYRPFCEQLEGNLPYCYYGKTGKVTVGCGVHIKDFKGVQNLPVLKVTPKKGKKFALDNLDRLQKIANANWQNPESQKLFPEVEKVEKVQVKDCIEKCPKNTDKKWAKVLFLMPQETLKKINETAIQFHVQNAYKCHPNLFTLSPSLQLVTVDLIYNLGYEKYKTDFPKFQEALRKNDLWQAKEESGIKNNPRRTDAHAILIDSALLCEARCFKQNAQQICKDHRSISDKRKCAHIKTQEEKAFWKLVDACTQKNYSWYQVNGKIPLLEMANKIAKK